MDWKKFFELTIGKFVITILLFVGTFYPSRLICKFGSQCYMGLPFPFYGLSGCSHITGTSADPCWGISILWPVFLVNLIVWYFVSCTITNKFKKHLAEKKNLESKVDE
jgi:hypothetical protein